MAKYLQMDGVDDVLVVPLFSFTDVELDIVLEKKTTWGKYFSTNYTWVQQNSNTGNDQWDTAHVSNVLKDGVAQTNLTPFFPLNERHKYTIKFLAIRTHVSYVFANMSSTSASAGGRIYGIKYYNGTTLVAHYDMSTGTIQDQSGNGNHATLIGGTWMDDGTGAGGTGTDGTAVFELRQGFYQDSALQADLNHLIYSDAVLPNDLRHSIYSDGLLEGDTRQRLYQDSNITAVLQQMLYENLASGFDMLQTYFEDGQTGSTPFDIRIQVYDNGSVPFECQQDLFESGITFHDLKQELNESGKLNGDIRIILYYENFMEAGTRQLIYSDSITHFDTIQRQYDTDNEIIGAIHLKGSRNIYIEICGRQELYVNLEGGIHVTSTNQNFSMIAGDSKYLIISVEEVTDLSGCTFKWAAKERRDGTGLVAKTSTSGINVVEGRVQIKINPADTEALNGFYSHECEMTDTLGNVSTILTGMMTVYKSNV